MAVVAFIALLIPAAYAADVEVAQPHIAFLSDAGVAVACKGLNRRGCTTLMTEFVCGCVRAEEKWTLKPKLTVTPYVYTTTATIMHHELSHIVDVTTSLKEYAGALSLRAFPTELACISFIVDEKKMFAGTMHNIQRMTTVRRDGVQFAEHAGGQ
jgi:hypothetical protein